jgi:hypothetical protein
MLSMSVLSYGKDFRFYLSDQYRLGFVINKNGYLMQKKTRIYQSGIVIYITPFKKNNSKT